MKEDATTLDYLDRLIFPSRHLLGTLRVATVSERLRKEQGLSSMAATRSPCTEPSIIGGRPPTIPSRSALNLLDPGGVPVRLIELEWGIRFGAAYPNQ